MSTVSPDAVAADQLRAFVERIERLEEEQRAINGDKSEVYKEAKGNGFDVKVLRKLIADRRKDRTELTEFEVLYELYAAALGMRSEGLVRAHVETIEEFDAETGEIIDPPPGPDPAGTAGEAVDHASPAPPLAADGPLPATAASQHAPRDAAAVAPLPERSDTPSSVHQLPSKKRWSFSDPAHRDCLDPGQCGGFSNLKLCQRCREAAQPGQVA